jgi:hypothetical protein
MKWHLIALPAGLWLAGARPTMCQGSAAAGSSVAPSVITVHATDFAFDAPDHLPAGVTTLRLMNEGPGIHHLTIVRLDDDKGVPDLAVALQHPGRLPPWAVMIGGPDAVAAGGEATATVRLVAGNYALVCFVDVPGGVPHFARGMLRALTVTPASGPEASLPTPDVTITLSDYAFAVSGSLKAGHHVIEVRAQPGQPHEMELIRLDAGKTADQMVRWVKDMQGPPPGHLVGGIAPVVAGSSAYLTLDLDPGTYVLACFLPDASDGQSHITHGMIKTVKVN